MSHDNIDQEMARLRDSLPCVWWALYSGCIKAGFTESQAITIVQTFIMRNPDIAIIQRPEPPPKDDEA